MSCRSSTVLCCGESGVENYGVARAPQRMRPPPVGKGIEQRLGIGMDFREGARVGPRVDIGALRSVHLELHGHFEAHADESRDFTGEVAGKVRYVMEPLL